MLSVDWIVVWSRGEEMKKQEWGGSFLEDHDCLASVTIRSVQSLSRVWLLVTPWNVACQASLSFTISWSLLKLMSIKLVMPSNYLILCCPLLLLPSIFPSIRPFPVGQLFSSGGQSIGALASASVLPVIQGWFPLGLTGLISFLSKGLSRVFSSTTFQKHQFFGTQPSLWSNSHVHIWLLEKLWLWLYVLLLGKWHLFYLICCLCLS